MRLDGIHHITAITADATRNVDFYTRVLGLRMVKKTVNFDAPDVYHLYFGDDGGAPGSILTFFEFPGAAPGRAGAGMVHRIRWRVGSRQALSFWADRLAGEGTAAELAQDGLSLEFRDPEGLGLELGVVETDDEPLIARADGIGAEHALLGFDGARAYGVADADHDRVLVETLGFTPTAPGAYVLDGGARTARYAYDEPPAQRGSQGAGTVHHIAWCTRDEDHAAWRERVHVAGMRPTPIIDRQYFRSIYFREPSGVLFELASAGPGFAVDEAPDRLGRELRLPPQHEHLRARLERTLTPLAP
jgi:glyoxalase family protein